MDATQRLRTAAAEVAGLRALDGVDAATRERRDALRVWQAQRLAFTHADLLESPRYRDATRFFLDELYGVKDFSQRDAELARVIPTLTRFLPSAALETIADAVELDALSERLDLAMAHALQADPAMAGAPIDDDAYARAFRAAGARTDRERQVELVRHIGGALDRLVRHPLLGGLLGAMERPARMAGLSAMHEFLSSGFRAFKAMRGADEFVRIITRREATLMDRIWAGAPDPVGRQGPGPGQI
ncbi:MAG: FFLEELY motif protein [Burkholderiaceae bacterium]